MRHNNLNILFYLNSLMNITEFIYSSQLQYTDCKQKYKYFCSVTSTFLVDLSTAKFINLMFIWWHDAIINQIVFPH